MGLGQSELVKQPKTCTFNIRIAAIACGEDQTFLVTEEGLVYGSGSNQYEKLGLDASCEKK